MKVNSYDYLDDMTGELIENDDKTLKDYDKRGSPSKDVQNMA